MIHTVTLNYTQHTDTHTQDDLELYHLNNSLLRPIYGLTIIHKSVKTCYWSSLEILKIQILCI